MHLSVMTMSHTAAYKCCCDNERASGGGDGIWAFEEPTATTGATGSLAIIFLNLFVLFVVVDSYDYWPASRVGWPANKYKNKIVINQPLV